MKLFKHKRPFIIILITLLFLFVAKAYYDTHSIEVRHYKIKNSSLGDVLGGLKIAQLSDLHIRSIGLMEKQILEILKGEKPDLILITGDSIEFRGPYAAAISFFHQLKPSLGTFAVLGNTEYSNENGSCIFCHEEKSRSLRKKPNPIILRNSSVALKINGRTINVIGVDDPVTKKNNLRGAIRKIDPEAPSILLAHSPEVFEEASGFKIDLLLCGHTHGGQIFLTKYFRNIFPLEVSLEFIEGFFQESKVLMYVSKGVGTSRLPFRLGIKPEITFFNFAGNPSNPSNSIDSPSISNTSFTIIFAGLNLGSFIETFNILKCFNISTRLGGSANPTNSTNSTKSTNQKILFDFESESELKRLNWECHKWFELSEKNVTSGKYCLKVILPPGQYPGIDFQEMKHDWSEFHSLRMDIFNPAEEKVNLSIRIDDRESGPEYVSRFDTVFELKQGMNHISIPTKSIRTNIHHRPLNLKQIKRIIVFIMNNTKQRELYLDNMRLENNSSN